MESSGSSDTSVTDDAVGLMHIHLSASEYLRAQGEGSRRRTDARVALAPNPARVICCQMAQTCRQGFLNRLRVQIKCVGCYTETEYKGCSVW
ncbi:hypothetical protein IRJ41_012393 [Triplophysa rosa]|uniref:Uncharacterized protein n=1 Tax=Triplophysa rosa TaxID=992332 RepID=A0A9W7WR78_TRIRA|nr:hypothetical protein IRJ41_012393 [Triplophysa rosa]